MHTHSLEQWQHLHDFAVEHTHAEKRTRRVMLLTALMMVVEIIAGAAFGSMALLADGWHMATHVAAFGIAIFAYRYARNQANNQQFTFGTGKVSVLGGFASAVALAVVALVMALESVGRIFAPTTIRFNEAIGVAVIGLIVNLLSAVILTGRHEHDDAHEHDRHDHNLRAAYLHVLADAMTSVFAIVALVSGKFFGWGWMDPIMGLVGAVVITRWSLGLLRDTSPILLDELGDSKIRSEIQTNIERDSDNRIADLHVWHVGPNHLAATVSLVTHHPQPPDHYKQLLSNIPGVSHLLIEVNQCPGDPCAPSPV
ncbi:MAG: CDF family Co(II)/Ni(II) efflux transporter DmeF [bacterium]